MTAFRSNSALRQVVGQPRDAPEDVPERGQAGGGGTAVTEQK